MRLTLGVGGARMKRGGVAVAPARCGPGRASVALYLKALHADRPWHGAVAQTGAAPRAQRCPESVWCRDPPAAPAADDIDILACLPPSLAGCDVAGFLSRLLRKLLADGLLLDELGPLQHRDPNTVSPAGKPAAAWPRGVGMRGRGTSRLLRLQSGQGPL